MQDNTTNTVEEHLFNALTRTHLIENRRTCNYSRCGRTDKGVSALHNVVSLYLRSRGNDATKELNYTHMLNRLLPSDIRILTHREVTHDFDARFSCLYREYMYFFDTSGINLLTLSEICGIFVGTHDFRNFCKLDKKNRNTVRRILSCTVEEKELNVGVVVMRGLSFLWHQVRCMLGIALEVARGNFQLETIQTMLAVAEKKPNYKMASEIGLVLTNCAYEDVRFETTNETKEMLLRDLRVSFT